MRATSPMTPSPFASFGTTGTGDAVHRVSLRNEFLEVDVLTWGATIQGLRLRREDGPGTDVVLGYPTLAGYEADEWFMGAIVGRYANRIAGGRFTLDGTPYHLPQTGHGHTLHGGPDGFHRQIWTAAPAGSDQTPAVILEHLSPHEYMGFPGTLRATCQYLLEGRDLTIELRATTDRPTVVNLTQHAYFNLAGGGQETVEGHELWIDADRYLPTDDAGIPLASLQSVLDTPFDFRQPQRVGAQLRRADNQLAQSSGYDHWLLLNDPQLDRPSARLSHPDSGRTLEVFTDQPGLQLYSGNRLDGSIAGKHGLYRQTDGLCLEAQLIPDGPNRPNAGEVTLRPGEEYVSRTKWRLTAEQ